MEHGGPTATALPRGCKLTPAEHARYREQLVAELIACMNEANRTRDPRVPMCYVCGSRLGYNRPK